MNASVIRTPDGNKFIDVTHMAELIWERNEFALYELLFYNGEYGSELIETKEQLTEALSASDTKVCILESDVKGNLLII